MLISVTIKFVRSVMNVLGTKWMRATKIQNPKNEYVAISVSNECVWSRHTEYSVRKPSTCAEMYSFCVENYWWPRWGMGVYGAQTHSMLNTNYSLAPQHCTEITSVESWRFHSFVLERIVSNCAWPLRSFSACNLAQHFLFSEGGSTHRTFHFRASYSMVLLVFHVISSFRIFFLGFWLTWHASLESHKNMLFANTVLSENVML